MVLFCLPVSSALSSLVSRKIPQILQFSRISNAFWEFPPGLGIWGIQEYSYWKESWWWPTNCVGMDPWWSQEGTSNQPYNSMEIILKRTELSARLMIPTVCLWGHGDDSNHDQLSFTSSHPPAQVLISLFFPDLEIILLHF